MTAREIIEQAGGDYLGETDGMAWFNDPVTHSTMTVGAEAIVAGQFLGVVLVRGLMSSRRGEFERGKAGLDCHQGTKTPGAADS